MSVLESRPATAADEGAIWAIFHEVVASGDAFAFSPETTRQQALELWMPPEHATYVALVDGHVVGSYFLTPNQPGLGAHVCNAGYMVARRARGQGLVVRWVRWPKRGVLDIGRCNSISS